MANEYTLRQKYQQGHTFWSETDDDDDEEEEGEDDDGDYHPPPS